MIKKLKILLSFIGSNDAGKLAGKPDGAILTALDNEKFDQVKLLWNRGKTTEITYKKIAEYLKKEISKRKLSNLVSITELAITDITNHNKIYTQLKDFTDKLDKTDSFIYTAAISSGTPAMSVCWILLAESGDFSESNPLRLIQVKDPKFGKSENISVKIDTSLPRIVRLKEEVKGLKDLLPSATLSISKPGLIIEDKVISLAPVELSYYRYFAERIINDKGLEKFSGINTSNAFLKRIIEIHTELFPDLDLNRMELEEMERNKFGLILLLFPLLKQPLPRAARDHEPHRSLPHNHIPGRQTCGRPGHHSGPPGCGRTSGR